VRAGLGCYVECQRRGGGEQRHVPGDGTGSEVDDAHRGLAPEAHSHPGIGNDPPRHSATLPMTDLPALLGGRPIRPEGPPDWPRADDAVRQALQAAWAGNTWGKYCSGHVEALEARLASLCALPHALTCASGTLAVEVALRALPVQPGDEVALAAYDYGGNFLSVHALGARPVLVDVGPDD